MWQRNRNYTATDQDVKRIDYEYDLISGKVNLVRYQDGKPDAFYHFYQYDADNRIREVYTSSYPWEGQTINFRFVEKNPLWSREAKYFYYPHGPLARVETGEFKSQGTDYAYTLQGWLKGVNSDVLNPSKDMGNDGLAASPTNAKVGRDAFSYSLNYFAGDYAAIEATKWSSVANRFEAGRTNSYLFNARNDLYNGNISAMVTNMAQPKLYTSAANEQPTLQPQGMAYKYDQLNRIKNANAYTNLNTTNNEWETTGGVPANYYRNTFTYDGNGNILNQTRYAQTTLIDDLSYKYTRDANQKLLRNQLNYVTDAVVGSTPTDDIESQSLGNYKYDELGNLRKDSIEQIETIEWNVYGKIKKIKRYLTSTKSNLEFVYDPSGNRIAKIEKPDGTSVENGAASDQVGNWKITYYVRDATGNVMGNYYQTTVSGLPSHKLTEHPIYGSSRLGSDNTQLEMIAAVIPSPFTRTIGNKYFEGVNHLGNVLSVYTDKKIPRDDNSDGTVDYYQAEVVSCSDYTPFGAPMNERTFSSNKYRYGFNGKEKDDEVKGAGNDYDFGERIYDPRLGKWLSLDPLMQKYPDESPYCFSGNSPISLKDDDGKQKVYYITKIAKDGTQTTLKVVEKYTIKSITTQTTQSIGRGGVTFITSPPISNTKTFDVAQVIIMDERTNTVTVSEEYTTRERSNSAIVRYIEDNAEEVSEGFNEGAGIVFTSSSYLGSGNKDIRKSGKYTDKQRENIDLLGSVLNAASGAAGKKMSNLIDGFKKMLDVIQTAKDVNDNVVKPGVDKVKEIVRKLDPEERIAVDYVNSEGNGGSVVVPRKDSAKTVQEKSGNGAAPDIKSMKQERKERTK